MMTLSDISREHSSLQDISKRQVSLSRFNGYQYRFWGDMKTTLSWDIRRRYYNFNTGNYESVCYNSPRLFSIVSNKCDEAGWFTLSRISPVIYNMDMITDESEWNNFY
jgi:hypothetical protein